MRRPPGFAFHIRISGGIHLRRRRAGAWMLAGALLACAGGVRAEDRFDHWTLGEWLEAWPAQRQVMAAFEDRVAAPAGERVDFGSRAPARIAVLYPSFQASDYWRRNLSAFEARLREIGVPYRLEPYFSRPGDSDLQARQLREALEADPDYLIATLDSLQDLATIERLLARGRPRLILQNCTTPMRRFGSQQPLLYAGFDHEIGSRRLAEEFLNRYPDGADWVLLLFTDGMVSDQRGGAFLKAMASHSGMRLRDIYLTDGLRETSRQSVRDALERHPGVNFFFACATDVALGAVDALRETRRTRRVAVNGWGGGEAELRALAKGQLAMTVMRMNDDAGVAMAEAVSLDLRHLGAQVPTVYTGAFERVGPEHSPADIRRLEQRAFRYSGREEAAP